MRRSRTLFMILLRLSIALTVGIITYFGLKDMRQSMDIPDSESTVQSETEEYYGWTQDEFI
jgi:hypothetical protein